jgi:hypothetical protein
MSIERPIIPHTDARKECLGLRSPLPGIAPVYQPSPDRSSGCSPTERPESSQPFSIVTPAHDADARTRPIVYAALVFPSASAHVDRLIRVCRSGWRSSSERATALCKKGRTPRASTAISLNGKLRGILKDVKEIGVDEWSVGSYHRELDLVVGVSGERANVTCENGVLREECT